TGRPAQAGVLEAVMCLGGSGQPDGTWVDALPSPDAGAHTRSAIWVWDSFEDCDTDGVPDCLEIAKDPSLDADGDGVLDACSQPSPDLNGDGVVNGDDLGILLGAWGQRNSPADLNGDGIRARGSQPRRRRRRERSRDAAGGVDALAAPITTGRRGPRR
ncbi:MAG: hypothetical protein ACKOTD_11380, partial [Phycisphaerales bacterium]